MNLLFIDHHPNFQETFVPGFFKELGKHSKVLIIHQKKFLDQSENRKPVEVLPNVWSVQRSPIAPYRFILLSDTISKLDAAHLKLKIHSYSKCLDFHPDIIEYASPIFRNHIVRLKNSKTTFWFMDHYSQIPNQPAYFSAISAKQEIECVQKVDAVITSAGAVKNFFQPFSKQIAFIPSSADEESFYPKWMKQFPEPDIFKKYSRPIFGYAGGLNSILDWEALLHLAKSRPHYTFVLFGWIDGGTEFQRDEIFNETMRQKNVHFVGKISYTDLPAMFAHLDAGLVLDKQNDFSKTRNQNKIYQYLLSGIPVVGPFAQPDYEPFSSILHLSHTKEEFPIQCDKAIETNTLESSKKRREYAEQISLRPIVKYRIECYERIRTEQAISDFRFPELNE